MPPRFPHGLVRPPSKMDKSEMAVFALLGVSVSVGLFRMGSDVSVWGGGGAKGDDESDNDIRERALDAIGKCEVHLNKFGRCAQESGMLVLFQCRDFNAKIRECISEHKASSKSGMNAHVKVREDGSD
jgi:hypothetical protein